MRKSIVPIVIIILVAVSAIVGWRIYAPIESKRYAETKAVRALPSQIRITYVITHAKGPIGREQFTFLNDNGASSAAYVGTNQSGTTTAKFTVPIRGYDVSFLFDRVVQDGIWELTDRPPRGDTTTAYRVGIYQLANGQSGSHDFTFTDPHYWATTAGHQFHIHLDKAKPVPDLLKMQSVGTAEPRYAEIVDDLNRFGTGGFRATLAKARERLGSSA